MKQSYHAHIGAQMFVIFSKMGNGFPSGFKQYIIHQFAVLHAQLFQGMRYCKYHMEIGYGKSVSLSVTYPFLALHAIAFGTVSIPAAIISIPFMCTVSVIASFLMASQLSCTAVYDGSHDFFLVAG
jgi:hypothetical protein